MKYCLSLDEIILELVPLDSTFHAYVRTSLALSNQEFQFQFSPSRFDPNVKPFSQTLYNAAQSLPGPTSTTPSFGYNPTSATGLYHPPGVNSNSSGFFGYHRPVEVPTFWYHDPTSWFDVLEGEFEVLSITKDRTKYSYLLKGLGTSTCKSLSSVIQSLPATDKYVKLEEQISKKYSETAHQQIDKLFSRLLPSGLTVLLDESVTSANATAVVTKTDRLHEILKSSKGDS
ncbi:hypothetical protein TKK_0019084 [Trichogramma kaykai]